MAVTLRAVLSVGCGRGFGKIVIALSISQSSPTTPLSVERRWLCTDVGRHLTAQLFTSSRALEKGSGTNSQMAQRVLRTIGSWYLNSDEISFGLHEMVEVGLISVCSRNQAVHTDRFFRWCFDTAGHHTCSMHRFTHRRSDYPSENCVSAELPPVLSNTTILTQASPATHSCPSLRGGKTRVGDTSNNGVWGAAPPLLCFRFDAVEFQIKGSG